MHAAPWLAELITTGESIKCSHTPTALRDKHNSSQQVFYIFSLVAVPLIFYSRFSLFLPLKTLAQSSAKTNRFLFMLLAGQQKVLDSFKMEQEAQFKNSIILPTTFNQLDSLLKKKYY